MRIGLTTTTQCVRVSTLPCECFWQSKSHQHQLLHIHCSEKEGKAYKYSSDELAEIILPQIPSPDN